MFYGNKDIYYLKKLLKISNHTYQYISSVTSQMKVSGPKSKRFKANQMPSSMLVPNLAYFQIIGNGSRGSPKSLHLFTSSYRYLFNVGEGLQRLVIEQKCKLSKLSGIFITHSSWDNMGGLPGVMLCLRDIGVKKVTLHGPPKVENLFIMTKGFMETQTIDIEKHDYQSKLYDDGCLKVEYVPIYNKFNNSDVLDNLSSTSSSSTDEQQNTPNNSGDKVVTVKSKHKKTSGKPKDRNTLVAYIGQLHDRLGTLDIKKCLEAGVPANALLGKLKSGEDVQLDNGRIVKSVDVKSVDEPGRKFMVVECPSISYLHNLVTNPTLNAYHQTLEGGDLLDEPKMIITPSDKSISLIIHFTPIEIVAMPEYQLWMSKFGSATSHWMVNELTTGNLSFHDTARNQCKLSTVDSRIFPFPAHLEPHRNIKQPDYATRLKTIFNKIDGETINIKPGLTQSKFHMRPLAMAGFDYGECRTNINEKTKDGPDQFETQPTDTAINSNPLDLAPVSLFDKDAFETALLKYRAFSESISTPIPLPSPFNHTAQDAISPKSEKSQYNIDCETTAYANTTVTSFPQFIFLGTGSAVPNKTRNVSSIWVRVSPKTSFLMDCGEGTAGQAVRFFGLFLTASSTQNSNTTTLNEELINQMFRTLKGVFISHLHADHHLGLLQIIGERNRAFAENASKHHNSKMLPPKLLVISANSLLHFLRPYSHKHDEIMKEIEFINTHLLQPIQFDPQIAKRVCDHLEFQNISVIPVFHFKAPTGLSFSTPYKRYIQQITHNTYTYHGYSENTRCNDYQPSYKKIVYSGDTLPCQNLVEAGQGADLLIHESTMENDLQNEAYLKRHSTMAQAIDIGRRMSAQHILLTHFSQRYAKVPLFAQLSSNINNAHTGTEDIDKGDNQNTLKIAQTQDYSNIGYAFDNMQVTFDDLPLLPRMVEPLRLLYADDINDMQKRTSRLMHRKQMAWE